MDTVKMARDVGESAGIRALWQPRVTHILDLWWMG